MFLLLCDAFGQMRQVFHGAFDLAPYIFKLGLPHQGRRARPTPAGAVGERKHHRQIPHQFLSRRSRLRRHLLMGF
jgi:hypothetical protein